MVSFDTSNEYTSKLTVVIIKISHTVILSNCLVSCHFKVLFNPQCPQKGSIYVNAPASERCRFVYRISSNKRRASNKRLPLTSAAPLNTALIRIVAIYLLQAKAKCIWTSYANNKTMKILLIFRFFHCIWFVDSDSDRILIVPFLFWKEKWLDFDIQYCSFPWLWNKRHSLINAAPQSFKI